MPDLRPHRALPPLTLSLVAAAVFAAALFGCKGEPASQSAFPVESVASPEGPHVLRMAHAHWAGLQDANIPPLELPLDDMWHLRGFDPNSPVSVSDEAIEAVAGYRGLGLSRDIAINTRMYNILEVELKAAQGTECKFSWRGDFEERKGRSHSMAMPIFPGDEYRTYTFNLGEELHWVGHCSNIRVRITDQAGPASVRAIRFRFQPPQAPRRITVREQTHEGLTATQPPWTLTIPPKAWFETHVAIQEEAWRPPFDGRARFRVLLARASGEDVELANHLIDLPGADYPYTWHRLEADLAPYAGERATIRLVVDGAEGPPPEGDVWQGDYAAWGSPKVYGPGEGPQRPPLILISCDTTRADHFSCYGYHRETTPNLDAFARDDAVLFENAITPETWTLPSHVSMLTGLHPKNHGATPHVNLAEEVLTLGETLQQADYLTAGFVGAGLWFLPWRGVSHGFDLYNNPLGGVREVFATHRLAETWLTQRNTDRLFLFLHNMDNHARSVHSGAELPYGPLNADLRHFANAYPMPEEPFKSEEGDRLQGWEIALYFNYDKIDISQRDHDLFIALYDDAIRSVDMAIGQTFDKLKELGLYDDAMIIVTSDHGESLLDHDDKYGHGDVYDACSRVPLIIKFPGNRFAGQRVRNVVQPMDFFPTVMAVLGMPIPEGLDGQDLIAVMEGRAEPKSWAYTRRYLLESVRSPGWKLIQEAGKPAQLFHLTRDPGERVNIYDSRPEALADIEQAAAEFYKPDPAGWHFRFWTREPETGKFNVVLATGDRFESCRLARGTLNNDLKGVLKWDPHSARINFGLIAKDELTIRTASADAKIALTLRSKIPFDVVFGDGPAETTVDLTTVLDPAAAATAPAAKPPFERPTFVIWYEEPAVKGTLAEITDQQREALEAMGYLDAEAE